MSDMPRSPIMVVADSLLHISLRITRSAWTTPDQRVCWLKCWGLPAVSVSVDSHVGDAGLVMRGRVVMLDTHQVRMPYMWARIVNASGVIIAMEGERSRLRGRDDGATTNMDMLSTMTVLNGGKKNRD